MRSCFLILAVSLGAAGQTFDVVSIRPSPPGMVMRARDFTPVQPRGGYVDSHTSLRSMISFAYNVQNPGKQLVGLPGWATQSYSVAAKAPDDFPVLSEAENREQVRAMLRQMLEDRFQLRVHTETREEAVFYLTQARGGVRLKEAAAPGPEEKEGVVSAAWSNTRLRFIGTKVTMAGMARMLQLPLDRPVIDRTGLAGYYDVDVRWDSPDAPATAAFGEDGMAQLISVLDDQFGLKLESGKGPVPFWVVDHVEEPSEN